MLGSLNGKTRQARSPRSAHLSALIAIAKGGRMAVAAGAMALAAAPALAEEHRFRVSIAGVTVADMSLSVSRASAGYTSEIEVRSTGLAGIVRKIRFDGLAHGAWEAGQPVPVFYEGVRNIGNGPQAVEMPYVDGIPTGASFSPRRRPAKAHDLVPSEQDGTLDPATVAMLMLDRPVAGQTCGRSHVVFDGIRRAELILGPRREAGRRWACDGVYRRTGGFPPRQMADQVDFPFTIFYDEADGYLVARRIELDSVLGEAVVTRR